MTSAIAHSRSHSASFDFNLPERPPKRLRSNHTYQMDLEQSSSPVRLQARKTNRVRQANSFSGTIVRSKSGDLNTSTPKEEKTDPISRKQSNDSEVSLGRSIFRSLEKSSPKSLNSSINSQESSPKAEQKMVLDEEEVRVNTRSSLRKDIQQIINSCILKGDKAYDNQQFDTALMEYSDALENLNTENTDAGKLQIARILTGIGNCYQHFNKYSQAEDNLRKSLEIYKRLQPKSPETVYVLNSLADALAGQKKDDEALILIDEALKIEKQKVLF